LLTPFPGTPLHRRLAAEGRILTRDWELYDGQHVVFQPKHMTVPELVSGHERAWRRVYSWPAIGRRLWRARNFELLAFSANLGYRFYARNLHRFYNCDWQIDPLFPNPLPGLSVAAPGAKSAAAAHSARTVCG
jgi:hypothetical protein